MPKGGKGKEVTTRGTRITPKNNHRGGFPSAHKEKNRQRQVARRDRLTKVVLAEKRLGVGCEFPPRIVGLVGGNEASNPEALFQKLGHVCEFDTTRHLPTTIVTPSRHRFTFLVDTTASEHRILDIAKVADIMLVALDCSPQTLELLNGPMPDFPDGDDDEQLTVRTYFDNIGLCITAATRNILRLVNAQGCPTFVISLQGLDEASASHRRRAQRLHERYFRSILSEDTTVVLEGDLPMLIRTLEITRVRRLPWRDQHPYFVAEEGEYDTETRTLKLCGFLRGSALSANQLVHITNHGTYALQKICDGGDPTIADAACGDLDVPDVNGQESLEKWRVNETAFNDEQDLSGFEAPTVKIRVPAGTSAYQAAWYTGETGGDDANSDLGITVDEATRRRNLELLGAADEQRSVAVTARTEVDELRLTDVVEAEDTTLEQKLEGMARLKEASYDEFRSPDEVDTPMHLPARQRFAKYRGMKSFLRGQWDSEENLPVEYARIFSLQGYSKIRQGVVNESNQNPVAVGTYVAIFIADVEPEVWKLADDILIVSGQLRHEQKWSLLHCHVQRDSEHTDPIKSKTPMLIHVGFRKFFSQPIYSDVMTGDRTRFARFFHPEEKFRIASFYGPISFHPCPVLMFNVPLEGLSLESLSSPRFFAFGSVLPPNPAFIILKRVVLSGRIAVIYKKQIVIKFMFYNDEDVRWYAPLDLYTRLGRRGKILKPLGEHGLFKAQFNNIVFQHDTVMMDLYKRVFPKWKTVPFNVVQLADNEVARNHEAVEEGSAQ